ncbi:MAG: P-II family nitrogen regulator [Lactobacillales bacterium]|jgi:nitrogen regulatory protein P-II 1|nr:P-II family nitrogen regulator [Lactobacillales bacterium]
MKKVEAIIRTEKLEELKKVIGESEIVHGVTVSQVLGFGNQQGFHEYLRGQKIITTLLTKVKLEMVVEDNHVDQVIDLIIEKTRTGEVGDGKIFVWPIEEVVRIRTGESGREAL